MRVEPAPLLILIAGLVDIQLRRDENGIIRALRRSILKVLERRK